MVEGLIGLAGVLLGSLIVVGKDWWFVRQRRSEDTYYSAVRLSAVLEQYALKCTDVVGDDGTACGEPAGRTEHGESFNEPQVSLPPGPTYPDDIVWRSLPPDLMYRALALPNAALNKDRYIANAAEHSGPPDYDELFEARHRAYAQLGLEAVELAEELRKAHGIVEMRWSQWDGDWNPTTLFDERLAELEKRKQK